MQVEGAASVPSASVMTILSHVAESSLSGSKRAPLLDGVVAPDLAPCVVDLARAEGVVSDLGVAHVLVAGQADGQSMSPEARKLSLAAEVIEGGGARQFDGIPGTGGREPDTVHDGQHDGTRRNGKAR